MKYITHTKKFITALYTFFALFCITIQVQAQEAPVIVDLKDKTIQEFVTDFFLVITKYVLTLMVSLTVFAFLYGLMKYMYKGQSSDAARLEGRKLMLWGIIGLFVMTSVWGLVAIIASAIGHTSILIPQFR